MTASTRSYEQLCPVAMSLDVIGDRWTMLILRDLLWHGPRGFQQMLDANPGLSPTILAERLKRLAEDDLAERIEVRRGRQSVVYRLTERGREVEPVVDALYRFGGAMLDTIPLSFARISYALDAACRRAGDAVFELPRAELRLVVDGVAIDLRLAPGMLVVAEGLDDPDAVATMDRLAFLALVGGSAPEGVAVEGDGLVFEVLRAVLSGGQP